MTASLLLIGLVTAATFLLGVYGVRIARTTSDFFVATRAVGPGWNASAIAGEYLSAASFLGIAGLVMKQGAAAMWYPFGYAAGYFILLLFVAAPLRRFGAYTLPDFAEGRFRSRGMRRLAAVNVLIIGWFYLLPQMKGAGITLELILGTPYWVGVVVVGSIVTAAVALGGMKGITYVQAFHYWVKLFAISVPAILLLALVGGGPADPFGDALPTFAEETAVEVPRDLTLNVGASIDVVADGVAQRWTVGQVDVAAGTELVFPAGGAVPTAAPAEPLDGVSWTVPIEDAGRGLGLLGAISLTIATVLGTMGLPHILVRFYTNRDAASARRTAVATLVLVGGFYFFPWTYAVIGRMWSPELYVRGETELVVLALPALLGGSLGTWMSAIVAAGAFSAFLSTSSGLLISVAGALSHDMYAELVRPEAGTARRVAYFRVSAVIGGAVAIGLGMLVRPFDINVLVGWAFAIAASAFCPLLLLGLWWRRLTRDGAAVGMAVGGLSATAAILMTMISPRSGVLGALLSQPAIVTVPLAFAVMIGISWRGRPNRHADRILLMMHAPDEVKPLMGVGNA